MKIQPFKLERFFARFEFTVPFLLCCSDCEAISQKELLQLADEDSLEMWNDLKLGYTESLGHPVLREEITSLYKTVSPENVLVVIPEEGIYITMNTVLREGDHVITTFPGYQSLYEIAYSLNCEVSRWCPEEKDGKWLFNLNSLRSLIKDNTRLVVINFPHNPTGAILESHELESLANLLREKSIILFSDEMYRFLEYDNEDRLVSACDMYDNAVSLFGMSKSFALAGLRIGWLTTKNTDLYQQCALYKDYTTICSSAPSEILAIMALRVREKILERNLNIIKNNLRLLDNFFKEYSEIFSWNRPKAGPIAFPKLNAEVNIEDFCLDLIEKKGVLLLPSNLYDYEGNNFRIGFARKNMPQALNKLKEYIREYYNKK
ncbi:MAG: aminotransferase class I/II-fold pyridoxal phosphate-dependent enzyme [bacterium]